jgi:hypothetical protein
MICYNERMKFFIASPWRNKEVVKKLTDELVARGHEPYSFLQSGANLSTGMPIMDEIKMFSDALRNWESDPRIKQIFDSEMEGLKKSDVVILLQPAGHSSLLTAGIGYGMGKEVVTIGPIEQPEVFYFICKHFYDDIDAFLSSLGSAAV